MKILMILHAPWVRELGLSQCSIELAEEFRALGHEVDKFDIRDAFPRRRRIGTFEHVLFARRAVAFVRRHGREYDVIQAEQGNLPVPKSSLGYDGALVCRSDGLVHFYAGWLAERKRRGARRQTALHWIAGHVHGGVEAVDRSFEAADAIVLLNRDELRFVADTLGHGAKAVLLPNGLSEERLGALAAAAHSPETRLREQHVVYVGHLSERKGLNDFPKLVRAVRERAPGVRFSLLGTAMGVADVMSAFAEEDRSRVRVIERFAPDDLPGLLADATVGVLPSYLEGFPLGALEQLAAGVPTVAYDAPGTRDLLGPEALTPAGDTSTMADVIARIVLLPKSEYAALAEASRALAGHFRWRDIARQTLAVYETARRAR
jgi:glycosyltransferase involved in cell wall biosynthesis